MNGYKASLISVMTLLVMGAVVLACAGGSRSLRPAPVIPIPRSFEEASRDAIVQALSNLTLPAGAVGDLAVHCLGDSAGTTFAAAGIVFGRTGYRVIRDGDGFPRVTIRVDSLTVTQTETRSPFKQATAERFLRVSLTAEYLEGQDATPRVFTLTGSASDRMPAGQGGTSSSGQIAPEPSDAHAFAGIIKPAALAAFMTMLAWSLYSYRG